MRNLIQNYLWSDNTDETKYMSDREILEKYIDQSNTCLHEEEKRKKLWICCTKTRMLLV